MRYKLFVGNNCHDCEHVVSTIAKWPLDISIINVDNGAKPPFDIFIYPALLDEDNELLAYGYDIITLLESKKPTSFLDQLKKWFS